MPKAVRDALQLTAGKKVKISINSKHKSATLEPTLDFITLAEKASVKNFVDPIKAREMIEDEYERI